MASVTVAPMVYLPAELLTHIFSFADKATHLNIARSSKRLYDFVVPLLYARIDLHSHSVRFNLHHDDLESPGAHLVCLTRLLGINRNLAAHVKHLSLRGAFRLVEEEGWDSFGDGSTGTRSRIPPSSTHDTAVISWLTKVANRLGVLTLLITLLPNLETLDVETEAICDTDYLDLKTDLTIYGSPTLDKLTSIMISHNNPSASDISMVSRMLTPRSLKDLYLSEVISYHGSAKETDFFDVYPSLAHPSLLNLENIDLHSCSLDIVDLSRLIDVPKALKAFCYESSVVRTCSIGHDPAELVEILLQYQSQSLLSFALYHGDDWGHHVGLKGRLDLTAFPILARIKLAASHLFPCVDRMPETMPDYLTTIMPRSLTELHILYCATSSRNRVQSMLENLETLLTSKESSFPGLNALVIELVGPATHEEARTEISEALLGLAREVKVQVKVMLVGDKEEERLWGFDEDVAWKACSGGKNRRKRREVLEL